MLQHGSGVTDGLAFEVGRSTTAYRAPNSSKVSTIEEFRDLDKLGHGFKSVDPLEEIDIGEGDTPGRLL